MENQLDLPQPVLGARGLSEQKVGPNPMPTTANPGHLSQASWSPRDRLSIDYP